MPLLKGFGRARDELWRQLAETYGGHVVKQGFFGSDRVLLRHEDWTIVFDIVFNAASKTSHTRIRAPFVNPERFHFEVYRRGILSGLAKALGMQDVEIGDPEFDRDFIVKGTDPARLRALLASSRLRELLARRPRIRLAVSDRVGAYETHGGPEVDELTFVAPSVIRDLEELKGLYELFAETLDQLCRIGAAYEDAPEPSRCPVCGHLLVAQRRCPECGNPVTA